MSHPLPPGSITFTGLSVSTTYYMRVRYRSSSGKVGDWSGTKVFSTKASFVPSLMTAELRGEVSSDLFSTSCKISKDGTTLVLGANGYDTGSFTNTGRVYVYLRNNGGWSGPTIINPPNLIVDFDNFGEQVDISDDGGTIVISTKNKSSADGSSAAYVFTRTGSSLSQQAKLLPSDLLTGDFRVCISGDGNYIILGAYNNNGGSGAGYVFVKSVSNWTQQAKLTTLETGATTGEISCSINLDGTYAVIGENRTSPGGVNAAGSVYTFTRSGTTWTRQQRLTPTVIASTQGFGQDVCMSRDGTTVIVSDKSTVGTGNPFMNCYIFALSGSTWSQQAIITPDNTGQSGFGWDIDLSSDGNYAIIGAPFDVLITGSGVVGGGVTYGAAYIFKRTNNTWSKISRFTLANAVDRDFFGYSVSINNDASVALIGSPGRNVSTGHAYFYS